MFRIILQEKTLDFTKTLHETEMIIIPPGLFSYAPLTATFSTLKTAKSFLASSADNGSALSPMFHFRLLFQSQPSFYLSTFSNNPISHATNLEPITARRPISYPSNLMPITFRHPVSYPPILAPITVRYP